MRLQILQHGHGLSKKLTMGAARLVAGMRMPDVALTLMYRPQFFGRPYGAWMQAAMRGPSGWSIGERELFAAFASRLNHCVY